MANERHARHKTKLMRMINEVLQRIIYITYVCGMAHIGRRLSREAVGYDSDCKAVAFQIFSHGTKLALVAGAPRPASQ